MVMSVLSLLGSLNVHITRFTYITNTVILLLWKSFVSKSQDQTEKQP
jgi:hypothetical protein